MERLPTSQLLLLTPSLFLHAFQSLLLPAFGLLGLLVAPAFMEVLHHHAYKHVEHEEGDDQEEGDEVEQHPWVVVHYRLKNNRKIRKDVNSGWLQTQVRHNQVRSADVDARPRQLMAQVIELAKLLYLTHKCFVAATCFATSSFCVCNLTFTCWSTPTASSPSYIMSTHPSFDASTKRDIKA